MLTLNNFLDNAEIDITPSLTKLVRHKSKDYDLNKLVIHDYFELYQSIQRQNRFHNCQFLVSFIGLDKGKTGRSKFVGVYEVQGMDIIDDEWPEDYPFPKMHMGNFKYQLNKVSGFEDLEDRLIIDWGKALQSWHQWYEDNDKEVLELLPDGFVKPFEGYLDFILDYKELSKIIDNPDSNREWHHKLSSVAGIYVIKDTETGKQYIGSASGGDGIWGRWSQYAKNGHGGNTQLKKLHHRNTNYSNYFEYSILRILPKNISTSKLHNYEGLYKNKLGSRAYGLNSN